MKKKMILVMPGSYWQVALAERIKQLGHSLLIVDPHMDAPCRKYADIFLQSDIFDFDSVFSCCQQNKVDAVISDQCDIAMPMVAKLGEALQVPTMNTDTAALYTNKFLMREFCQANDIHYPEYRLCKTAEDAIALLAEIKRPLILKPLDSNASKGVFRVDSEEDIRHYFEQSMSFSRSKKYVLAERYIEGAEFTIDGIKTPSAHYTLAISEKKHFAHNQNIASELYFSHNNSSYDYDALRERNDSFVMSSTLSYGFTHAEYKFENGKYYLIEIGARGGGNMISSIITQYMSGHDTYRYLVECSLGNIHDEDFSIPTNYQNRAAVLKFFKTPQNGGTVKKIQGLEYLDTEPDIVQYMLNFRVGDVIENAKSDSARIGFYIACSENKQKLDTVIKNVENQFDITLEN